MFTLKEIKDMVLALFDEFSIDNQIIAAADNGDYTIRIPMLVNMLQLEWCRLVKISTSYTITHTKIEALYTMPSNFMEIEKIVKKDSYGYKEYNWKNRKTLKLLETDEGEYEVYYYKYPTKLTSNSLDTVELDSCDEVSNLFPLKIASLLVKPEDTRGIAPMLLDMYDSEKRMLISRQIHEPQRTEVVYSIGG